MRPHTLAAPLALLALSAPTASAQSCAELDINGCGCLDLTQFTSMLALVAAGDDSGSATGNGDYDADGDVDGIDLAFWLANFIPCTDDIGAPTRTGYPEPGGVPVAVRRLTLNDSISQYEVLALLDGPLDEVIAVTNAAATPIAGFPPGFLDPGQDALPTPIKPLGQAFYDSLGIDADTYIAIGDRTNEPAPFVPLLLDLDTAAYDARQAVIAPLGWQGDWLNTASPTVSGAGGAAGNTDNEVLLMGLALNLNQIMSLDLSFAVATADGRLLISRTSRSVGPGCPADVNQNGIIEPGDFGAWVIAFNTGLPTCDQNFDGLCTPADLSAWIINFNTGC